MTAAPIRTAGNARPWQSVPPANRLGDAPYRHGPLQPLASPRPWWARLMGRG